MVFLYLCASSLFSVPDEAWRVSTCLLEATNHSNSKNFAVAVVTLALYLFSFPFTYVFLFCFQCRMKNGDLPQVFAGRNQQI